MARKHAKDRGIVLKDETWWVRLYVNGREKWYRCDNKSQAKTLYCRIKAEIREGRYFPEKFAQAKALTLRAWISRYLEGVTSRGLRNMRQYGRFWSKLLGRRLLTEISSDELRHIQAKLYLKKKRAPRTINRYFGALRRILNLAIAEGYLSTNPVKGVKFFPEPAGRLRFLSEGEISRLREKLAPEHWPLVAFALETGLRLSEQFHARWDCVNIEQGVLTVPLSKSGRTRHVMLSEAALTILRSLSSWMHSPYLFPSPLNAAHPMQGRHFVVKVYDPALKAAGITDTTWHTLRHTFASRAVMAGVDIRTVQELMGHSTITMTMRYAHLSPAHLREAVNKASLGAIAAKTQVGTGSKTGSNAMGKFTDGGQPVAEPVGIYLRRGGGAERVRTAASQFCRLLP
jgi:integrase